VTYPDTGEKAFVGVVGVLPPSVQEAVRADPDYYSKRYYQLLTTNQTDSARDNKPHHHHHPGETHPALSAAVVTRTMNQQLVGLSCGLLLLLVVWKIGTKHRPDIRNEAPKPGRVRKLRNEAPKFGRFRKLRNEAPKFGRFRKL